MLQRLKALDVDILIPSYQGITDRRRAESQELVEQFSRQYSLGLIFLLTDKHSGQLFGRPDLVKYRPDLPEEVVEAHTFSTGGKDWLCYRRSVGFLLDDTWQNLAPARGCGVQIFQITSQYTLQGAVEAVIHLMQQNRELYTVAAVRDRLRSPPEAPEE